MAQLSLANLFRQSAGLPLLPQAPDPMMARPAVAAPQASASWSLPSDAQMNGYVGNLFNTIGSVAAPLLHGILSNAPGGIGQVNPADIFGGSAQAATPTGPMMDNPFVTGGGIAAPAAAVDPMARVKAAVLAGGGNITSAYRDSAKQAQLYARYQAGQGPLAAAPGHSMHEMGPDGMAVDIAMTKGMTKDKAAALVAQGGVTPTEVLSEGDHFHVGWAPKPGTTADPMATLAAGLRNPFDPSYGDKALATLSAAGAAASKPQTIMTDAAPPLPTMPTPQFAAPADYSKVNADLAAAAPKPFGQADQDNMRRNAWMQGIGQALTSLQGGEGLGTVLARIGGGALQGSARGNDEVQARVDRYDQANQAYHMALANNDLNQATAAHADMVHQMDVTTNFALQAHQEALQKYYKDNNTTVTDAGVVSSVMQKDGKIAHTFAPFAASVGLGIAKAQASVLMGMQSGQETGNAAVDGPLNSLLMYHAATAGANGQPNIQAITQSAGYTAGTLVGNGQAPDLFGGAGSSDWKAAEKEVISGIPVTLQANPQEFKKAYDARLGSLIARQLMDPKAGQFAHRALSLAGIGMQMDASAAFRATKDQSTTDSRGRTTTQTRGPVSPGLSTIFNGYGDGQ